MKKTNIFKDLYRLLTNTKKTIYTKQLHDGSVYVYDNKFMLASFRYYGGTSIINLKLNTKKYLGKKIYPKLHMADYLMEGGDALNALLKQLFPDANKCNWSMKHAYEFSIIEAALLDLTTQIEVTDIRPYMFNVAMVNVEGYVSCSFRYLPKTGVMKNIFLRYSSRVADVRLDKIIVPVYRRHLFDELLVRELTPID